MDIEEYRTRRHVSTLRFVLFLYCQGVSTQKLRNSSFTENWPGQSLPSGRDNQTKNIEKIIDNLDHLVILCGKNSNQKNTISYEGLKGKEVHDLLVYFIFVKFFIRNFGRKFSKNKICNLRRFLNRTKIAL